MAINSAPIRIIRFWTAYTNRNGVQTPRDMVEYCAPGMAQMATTVAVVMQLAKVRTDIDPDNPAYQLARMRWEIIGPAYKAWKAGQDIPVNGTPLAAWSGITPEQAEIVRSFGLRTVEEVAAATDGIVSKVQLPGMRDIRDNARLFIESADQNKLAAQMAEKDREIASMRADMEELRQMLIEASKAAEPELNADGSEAPRRRGRPPKVREEAPDVPDEAVA
jgi:hypothetical protein